MTMSRPTVRICRTTPRNWASFLTVALTLNISECAHLRAAELEPVQVSKSKQSFVLQSSGRKFTPWGFNYDHDEQGRLIEDYWANEWAKVEQDFSEMKQLGANVVRIHLQFGKFMVSAEHANTNSLTQLGRLVRLAKDTALYLDVTGLGCYHKHEVPAWYDALPEEQRWAAQAQFWRSVARTCKDSPAIFCYDLMNEPVVPPSKGKRDDWLGGAFAGKHFVQWIALESKGRERTVIAQSWIRRLVTAIRTEDKHHLITLGLVPWSLDRPGLDSGFHPDAIVADLDFISVHIYPERGKVSEALDTLRGFAVGKPVVIEETFPLKCSLDEFGQFMRESKKTASGWIGFYWGKTPAEYRASKEIGDALMLGWLEYFQNPAR
jgi:hypothetical protein